MRPAQHCTADPCSQHDVPRTPYNALCMPAVDSYHTLCMTTVKEPCHLTMLHRVFLLLLPHMFFLACHTCRPMPGATASTHRRTAPIPTSCGSTAPDRPAAPICGLTVHAPATDDCKPTIFCGSSAQDDLCGGRHTHFRCCAALVGVQHSRHIRRLVRLWPWRPLRQGPVNSCRTAAISLQQLI